MASDRRPTDRESREPSSRAEADTPRQIASDGQGESGSPPPPGSHTQRQAINERVATARYAAEMSGGGYTNVQARLREINEWQRDALAVIADGMTTGATTARREGATTSFQEVERGSYEGDHIGAKP